MLTELIYIYREIGVLLYMNKNELNFFIEHYIEKKKLLDYELDGGLNQRFNSIFQHGDLLSELYMLKDPTLISLLKQKCDHNELISLLKSHCDQDVKNGIAAIANNNNIPFIYHEIKEPLVEWIYNYRYTLACPLLGWYERNKKWLIEKPEMVLSMVYIRLTIESLLTLNKYNFNQDMIEQLYEKSNGLNKYGLIVIEKNKRELCAHCEPVRLFDILKNKTIFLYINRSFAIVLDELYKNDYIGELSLLGKNDRIYDGLNNYNHLYSALERGRFFKFDIASLPETTKLFRENYYNDCLWVSKDDNQITFEELYDNINLDNNCIVTQVVHLQYDDNMINHIDHEYVFYDIDEYVERLYNPKIKGNARKRVKTFKADNSKIPFNYYCEIFINKGDDRIETRIPFIYYVLNNFFEHKDLLDEYFKNIL